MQEGAGERKHQILREACQLIATDGYASFSMRAVARASGLTLGALQYHYRTRDVLLGSLADFFVEHTRANFSTYQASSGKDTIHAFVDFMLVDPLSDPLDIDRLFPQLWAMSLVEPIMKETMDSLYEEFLLFLEEGLRERKVATPRSEALVVMSMLEGLTLFVGRGQRWEEHAASSIAAVHALIDARYGPSADLGG